MKSRACIRPQSLTRQPQHYSRTPDEPEILCNDENHLQLPLEVVVSKQGEQHTVSGTNVPEGRGENALRDTLTSITNKILHPSSGVIKTDFHVRVRHRETGKREATRIDIWETHSDATNSDEEQGKERTRTLTADIPDNFYKLVPSVSESDEYRDNDQCGLGHVPIEEVTQQPEPHSLSLSDISMRNERLEPEEEEEHNEPLGNKTHWESRDPCKRTQSDACAEPDLKLTRNSNIPSSPPGNCLFYSLMQVCRLDMTTSELRATLLRSSHLNTNDYPEDTAEILRDSNRYGDDGCISLFAKVYNQNVCVHLQIDRKTSFHHFKIVDSQYFVHLHLQDTHYTPLLRYGLGGDSAQDKFDGDDSAGNSQGSEGGNSDLPEDSEAEYSQEGDHALSNNEEEDHEQQQQNSNTEAQCGDYNLSREVRGSINPNNPLRENNGTLRETEKNQPDTDESRHLDTETERRGPLHQMLDKSMTDKYVVINARPPREKPPWAVCEGEQQPPFSKIEYANTHPFRCSEYMAENIDKLSQRYTMASMNLVQSKYSKFYYDNRLNMKHFREGEIVYLLKRPRKGKFGQQYEGPHGIVDLDYQNRNFKIIGRGTTRIVYSDRLKRAIRNPRTKTSAANGRTPLNGCARIDKHACTRGAEPGITKNPC